MFHKEGRKIILITTMFVSISVLLIEYFIRDHTLRMILQLAALVLFIAILQFFRNPNRKIGSPDVATIVAPVDGKVVVIEEVYEKEYFKDKRLMVSIFMSPVNVHVTRYALSGEVTYSKYHPGKYLVAWHPKASEENERTTVVVKNDIFGEVMYRQIAGALAKRIVNYAKVGDQVKQGDDAGFIKFGSRVDLYLPLGTKVEVSLKQKAKGNRTLIARKEDTSIL